MARFRNLIPLILPILITFSFVGILRGWEAWREKLHDEETIAEWTREAKYRVEKFRALYPRAKQFEIFFQRVQREISLRLSKNPDEELSSRLVMALIKKHIPPQFLPKEAVFYGFKINDNGAEEPFQKDGFQVPRSKILSNLLSQIVTLGNRNPELVKRFDRRAEGLFGPMVSAELLFSVKGNQIIRGLFAGKAVEAFWQTFSVSGKEIGGVMLFLPPVTSEIISLQYALKKLVWCSDSEFFPLLLPLQNLRNELSPILSEELAKEPLAERFLTEVSRISTYSEIVQTLDLSKERWGMKAYRSPIDPELPYEIWILREEKPGGSRFPFSQIFFCALIAIWGTILSATIVRDRPPALKMRWWLIIYLILISGVPILMVHLMGFSFLEMERNGRIRQDLEAAERRLAEIDIHSSGRVSRFGKLCGSLLASGTFKDLVYSGEWYASHPRILKLYDEFDADGFPLETLLIKRFGIPKLLTSPPTALVTNMEEAYLGLFLPISMAGLKFFAPSSIDKIVKTLTSEESMILGIYALMLGETVSLDVAFLRQIAEVFQTGERQIFQYYDLLGEGREISTIVAFRANAEKVFYSYVMKFFHNRFKASPESKFFFGRAISTGKRFLDYWGRFDKSLLNRVKGLTAGMLTTKVSKKVHLGGNSYLIGFPGKKMENVVLGEIIDLTGIEVAFEEKKLIMSLVSLGLGICVVILGLAVTGYFFRPIEDLQKALERISSRDLDVRLNLVRDDELGDVSKAFDEMTEGLQQRYELGQFVSGTLDASVSEKGYLDMEPQVRFGAVLASDIRGFTTLSEKYPVEEIVQLLNLHLEVMSREVRKNGGMVDDFIGDAIVAVFLDSDPETAVKEAVAAARGMMIAHEEIKGQRTHSGLFSYSFGIGVSCGEVMIGTFGDADRLEFGILGAPRDNAEVMETLSKSGKFTRIVLHEKTWRYTPDLALHRMIDPAAMELIELK